MNKTNREGKKWLSIYSDLSHKLKTERELQHNTEFMTKLREAREHAVAIMNAQKRVGA